MEELRIHTNEITNITLVFTDGSEIKFDNCKMCNFTSIENKKYIPVKLSINFEALSIKHYKSFKFSDMNDII